MNDITFIYETPFELDNPSRVQNWICVCLDALGFSAKQISIAFMDDESLLRINKEFLKHDYYTDVITFDYSIGNEITCDLAISVDRVEDNATNLRIDPEQELFRVIIHGLLHCCGFDDKTDEEIKLMREKENTCLSMFHVEPKSQNHV